MLKGEKSMDPDSSGDDVENLVGKSFSQKAIGRDIPGICSGCCWKPVSLFEMVIGGGVGGLRFAGGALGL